MLKIFNIIKSIMRKKIFGRVVISLALLSVIGAIAANKLHSKKLLDSKSQNKADDLSSLDRVKAIYNDPKIKKDLISDEGTQKLLAESGSPIEEYSKPKNLVDVKDINDDINKVPHKTAQLVNESTHEKSMPEEPHPNTPCDVYDSALSKCQMPTSYENKVSLVAQKITDNTKGSLSDAKVDGSVQINEANLKGTPIPADKTSSKSTEIVQDDSSLKLLAKTASQTEVLMGRTVSIGGAENQIKAGTTVLAVLNEAKTITSAGETYATASIIGAPFDRQKFPEGVTVLLKMKLNGTQDGIEGVISTCSSRRNSDKSISCSGQLEDISGASALRGEVYSSAGWQIVTTAATTFLAGLSLSKLTTSATTLGTTVDQTTSNALYQALSGAITSMGTQIATSFARSGTQISIPGRVVVRILFTQDSVW